MRKFLLIAMSGFLAWEAQAGSPLQLGFGLDSKWYQNFTEPRCNRFQLICQASGDPFTGASADSAGCRIQMRPKDCSFIQLQPGWYSTSQHFNKKPPISKMTFQEVRAFAIFQHELSHIRDYGSDLETGATTEIRAFMRERAVLRSAIQVHCQAKAKTWTKVDCDEISKEIKLVASAADFNLCMQLRQDRKICKDLCEKKYDFLTCLPHPYSYGSRSQSWPLLKPLFGATPAED